MMENRSSAVSYTELSGTDRSRQPKNCRMPTFMVSSRITAGGRRPGDAVSGRGKSPTRHDAKGLRPRLPADTLRANRRKPHGQGHHRTERPGQDHLDEPP